MKGDRGSVFALSVLAVLALSVLPAGADPVSEWEDLYDAVAQPDVGIAAAVDAAGNPVIAGESYDGVGGADMLIRKLDRESRSAIWTRRISAEDGNDMAVAGIVRDRSGDFLVGGTRLGCYG